MRGYVLSKVSLTVLGPGEEVIITHHENSDELHQNLSFLIC